MRVPAKGAASVGAQSGRAPSFSRRVLCSAAAAVSATAGFVACGGGPAGAVGRNTATGNVASYALPVGQNFSWMLPLENEDNYEDWDSNVEGGMWLPLYFAGTGTRTGIDYGLSIGKKPVYSDGDRTVTVTMNTDFTWSDGTKVTSADVRFFFELISAGKTQLGNYVAGEMPDDIASITYPGPYTFVLHLKQAYNPAWFTGNQLTWIYPLPQQTWDRTCSTCAVGDDAATAAGAKKVFDFLFAQSGDLRTYSSNPLWRTVDGPWVITSFDPVTYEASFAANRAYTGPTPPRLSGYRIYSFTTGTAELDALRSGSITFGYLPLSDISEGSYFKSHGYTIKPWRFFYDEDIEFGYTSKQWGPLVKQLYVRQALQHLVDEPLYIDKTLDGYGLQDYGPVADYHGSSYVSPTLRKDPYPYSLKAAVALLKEHGWKKNASGEQVCARAGTGPHDCGAGIPKGKQLSFSFMYSTGTTSFLAQVSAFQTAAASVGIAVTLNGQTETTMFSIAGVCPSTPPCNYGLAGYAGFMWDYGQYQLVPSGDNQFGKGNFWAGGYYTATAQRLIDAADDQPGLATLYAAEDYLSKDVASLWFPLSDTVVVVKNDLRGWQHLNPYANYVTSTWYFATGRSS